MNTGDAPRNKKNGIDAARETVRRMTAPGGCAWHEAQTHESLIPYLIEETAEFVDAVERGLPADEVAAELGDVLYQVLFHAAIAERDGEGYNLQSVAIRLSEKLRARHPHVFGNRGRMSVAELHAEWEHLKEDAAGQKRGSRSPLDGIPAGMPTLARSAKVVERLKRAKLLRVEAPHAPTPQLAESTQHAGSSTNEEVLGDEILALIIKANAAGVDPDRALRLATARLAGRAEPRRD